MQRCYMYFILSSHWKDHVKGYKTYPQTPILPCPTFEIPGSATAIDDLVLFEIIFDEDYLTQGLIKQ